MTLACEATGCAAGLVEGANCDPTADAKCGLPDLCVTTGGASRCARAGYTEAVVPTLPFIDACALGTHVPLTASDTSGARIAGHAATAIAIPFAFRFWGSDQTQAWPSTRGFLELGAAPTHDVGVGDGYLPTDSFGPVIAPFWDEIFLGDAPASDICYVVAGTAPSRQLVIEWAHARRYGVVGSDLSFEVVLNETTEVIELAYEKLAPSAGTDAAWSDGRRAAIGLQSGYDGVAIAHDGTVSAGGSLRYTPIR